MFHDIFSIDMRIARCRAHRKGHAGQQQWATPENQDQPDDLKKSNGPWKVAVKTALLALLVWCWAAAATAETSRDPFRTPEQRINPYHYAGAIKQMALVGIVRAEKFNGCLVRVAGMASPVVLKANAAISLEHDGLPHQFRISAIKEKSVVFKDTEGRTYEVLIR